MKLLLDTHVLLWAAGEPARLPGEIRDLLDALETELWFSAANIWEVAIKSGLGRSDFVVDARLLRRSLLDNGWSELPITSEHTAAIVGLPPLHRDPFDRLLIAQATVEGVTLLTADEQVSAYPGPIRRI